MSVRLQEWIHKFEVGVWSRLVFTSLILFAAVALAVFYNLAAFRNLANREGMDVAQLARNIAQGHGYSTDVVRPLSLQLVFDRATNQLSHARATATNAVDEAKADLWASRLQNRHPDLVHPPVYPLLLAACLKINPFGYPDTTKVEGFAVYTPDLWIALCNQALLFLAAWLMFRLAKKLFDEAVAWVSVILLLGSELIWRFSISGLSTLLLIVIFVAMVHVVAAIGTGIRAQPVTGRRLLVLAIGLGVLTGLGALTRYSLGWLIVPVCLTLGMLPYARRGLLILGTVVAFLVVLSPWLCRNYAISGQPFGVAGYAVFEETASFPADDLERSSNPDFRDFTSTELVHKLFVNGRTIIESALPKLGGSWIAAFFLVSLLVPFRNPVLGELRLFTLLSLGMLVVVQALGKTAVSEESPEVNADNLIIVLAPMVILFGVSLCYILLDQFGSKGQAIRYTSAGAFCLIMVSPLLLVFVSPSQPRVVYPPYYPPWIQEKAAFLSAEAQGGRREAMMSDIPWAVAWYGGRQCLWLTRQYRAPELGAYRNDFDEIHIRIRPISALYISAKTLEKVKIDGLKGWIGRGEAEAPWESFIQDWESFLLVGIYLKNEVPSGFPLRNAPRGILPELFLIDSEHFQSKAIQ